MTLLVDDGENEQYNSTMKLDHQRLIEIDRGKGIQLGGEPEFVSEFDRQNFNGNYIII